MPMGIYKRNYLFELKVLESQSMWWLNRDSKHSAWNSKLRSHTWNQKSETERTNCEQFEDLKTPQIVPPTEKQVFKCSRLWKTSYLNKHNTYNACIFSSFFSSFLNLLTFLSSLLILFPTCLLHPKLSAILRGTDIPPPVLYLIYFGSKAKLGNRGISSGVSVHTVVCGWERNFEPGLITAIWIRKRNRENLCGEQN